MGSRHHVFLVAGLLLAVAGNPALAQKRGGILKMYFFDSPASMSIHEEATIAGQGPMMGVFNNLVMYKQDVPQASIELIVPDLASEWSWGEDGKELTFKLRQGVKWHDGKPFTSKDVKCTWDLLQGKATEKLRLNPRKAWYRNLDEVVPNGDYEVTFKLKRPQPAFIALLASGFTPVYPCHVSPAQMRQHPIGTGPFKFVEFKPNEYIKVDAQSGLLEKGPALSRRHRVPDHQERRDRLAGLRLGQGRHDLVVFPPSADAERHQQADGAGALPHGADERAAQRDHQPRGAAVWQAGGAASDRADA